MLVTKEREFVLHLKGKTIILNVDTTLLDDSCDEYSNIHLRFHACFKSHSFSIGAPSSSARVLFDLVQSRYPEAPVMTLPPMGDTCLSTH